MTDSGAMRHVIKVLEPSSTQDATGGLVERWNVIASRRAQKLAAAGSETFTSAQIVGRVPTEFKIRTPRTFTITPAMRIALGVTLFQVVSTYDPDGLGVDMVITCLELVGEPPWDST